MDGNLGQAGRPRGPIGRFFGWIMERHNRPDNEWTIGLLALTGSDAVLEVGFGPGQAIKLATTACPKCRIYGIDHSAEMLALASKTNREAIEAGNVQLALGGVDDLDFPDGVFDKAFSINCIYFWPEPLRGLRELFRVLKAGGRLAITVRDKNRAAYRPFRPEALTDLLTKAGFSQVVVHRNGVASHPLICVTGVK